MQSELCIAGLFLPLSFGSADLDRMPNTGHNHTLAEESSKVPKRRMATRRNAGQVSTPDDVIQEGQRLVAELCRGFYELGWVSGTGGSISIKVVSAMFSLFI